MSLDRRVTASANKSPLWNILLARSRVKMFGLTLIFYVSLYVEKCNTLSPLKYRWWGAKIAVKMRPGRAAGWSVSFVQLECQLIWWRPFLFHIGYKKYLPLHYIQKYIRRIAPQKHRQEKVEWNLIWWGLFSNSFVPKTISGLSGFSVSWWMF